MAKFNSNSQILMNDLIEQDFNENGQFDSKNSFFEFFAAEQVLKTYGFDSDEINRGLVGQGNDGGCDSLYILNNGLLLNDVEDIKLPKCSELEFIIIQSKLETKISEDVIMKWKTVCENLLPFDCDNKTFSKRYCPQVLDIFSQFRTIVRNNVRNQIKIKFSFYYVSLGDDIHINVKQQSEELKNKLLNLFPNSESLITFITSEKLQELYNLPTDRIIDINFLEQPISSGINKNYIALVKLSDYFKLITDSNGNLDNFFFDANVRDFQGENGVNTCINNTLSSSSDIDFWWLNNGVTILAKDITPITNRSYSIQNPKIVNGLQTSTVIYNYFSKNIDKLATENRSILVRFIVPKDEEVRDAIIFATNNQTNIPKSSLRVTDPIHTTIELYLKNKGLYYDRRKNYYKNQGKKATEIISVSFLAQCLISIILKKPDYARARPSTLLTDDDTYNKLYNETNPIEAYYNVARIGKSVQNNIWQKTLASPEKNDILFCSVYLVTAKILNKKKISFIDLKSIDLSLLTDNLINSCVDTVYNIYSKNGSTGKFSKSSVFIQLVDKSFRLKKVTNNTNM